MTDGVAIRAARPDDDVERVMALLALLALEPQPAADPARLARVWTDIFAQRGRTLFLAEDGTELVGTLDSIVVPNLTRGARPYLVVENVIVAPAHRRRGIGAALLDTAVAHAVAAGCYKLQLISANTRPQAHEFYQRAGFSSTAQGYRRYLTSATTRSARSPGWSGSS
jgi:ribosomal protein S18 acetylase RimI-like enzyme